MKKGSGKRKKLQRSKKKRPWKKIVFQFFSASFLFFIIVTSTPVFLFRVVNPPTTPLMWIRWIESGYPSHNALVLKSWRPLKQISPNLIRAAIAAEDSQFFKHGGIDWKAAWAAFKHNLNSDKKHGASTISMQTVRNIFLWQKRNWLRKSLEVYFTLLIELAWSKHRILEVYLNVIEWGDGIFGCDEAARFYYHRSPSKLSPVESVRMVSILPNPREWSLDSPPKYVIRRQNQILKEMKYAWVPPFD